MLMLTWMWYSVLVAAALGLAAALGERIARSHARPGRGWWVGALVLAAGLSAAAWWAPGPAAEVEATLGSPTFAEAPVRTGAAGFLEGAAAVLVGAWRVARDGGVAVARRADPWVLPLWTAASALLLAHLALSAWRLWTSAARWRPTRLHGFAVRVSHGTGPAVMGIRKRGIIVLPSWVLDEPPEAQRWILGHEAEHLRAGDHWLVLGAYVAVTLAPWNPAFWWQFKRLSEAVELDCDRRVLADAAPAQRRQYGALLLRVAERLRTGAPRFALAAFAERGNALERRIRTMLNHSLVITFRQRLALGLAAVVLLVLACTLPGPDRRSPTEPTVETAAEPVVPAPSPDAGPTFTPFTVGPDITNREVVQRALVEEYPPLLRDAGIGGSVDVWLFIDENGRVQDTRLKEGSGHAQLDEAALRVAGRMEFQPALNRDKKVPVWAAFPITFQVR